MSTPEQMPGRLRRILERLLERTSGNMVQWEKAALADSYGITIAKVRFRIRSLGGGSPPYALEFLGDANFATPIVTGDTIDSDQAQLVQNLYNAAHANFAATVPDPFEDVEEALDLNGV